MRNWTAHEFTVTADELAEPTGRKEYYQAATLHDAVNACRYSHALTNGTTHVGPTSRVVYSGNHAYVFNGATR